MPTLLVVAGPPGSGTNELAHALGRALPCPVVSRDEIKEGMVHGYGGAFEAAAGDPLTVRTVAAFGETLRVLLAARVTVVAEAAFQDALWRSLLEPLTGLAELRIVHCRVEPRAARARRRSLIEVEGRAAHAAIIGPQPEDWERALASFKRLSLPAPSLTVDTTHGYAPELAEIVAFAAGRRG